MFFAGSALTCNHIILLAKVSPVMTRSRSLDVMRSPVSALRRVLYLFLVPFGVASVKGEKRQGPCSTTSSNRSRSQFFGHGLACKIGTFQCGGTGGKPGSANACRPRVEGA